MAKVKESTLMKKYYLYPVKKVIFFVSLLICTTFLPISYADGDLCSGSNATLDCLSKNLDKLYSANYRLFWDILHKAEKKVQKCMSVSDTVNFMKLAHLKSNNAEFNEFFSEVIENLCVKKSKCFFEAMVRLKDEDQLEVVKKLKTPLFVDQVAINDAFIRNKNNQKYKKVIYLYFRNN